MEDRQNNAPTHEEACRRRTCPLGGFAPFFLGLAVALVFGWGIFPMLMYTSSEQPVSFSHETHIKIASLDCVQCHVVRPDGTFAGLPTTEDCAVCHSQILGPSAEERRFVNDYVRPGKEVKWLVYQRQPDNVFFTHAAHSTQNCNFCHQYSERELCTLCHMDMAATNTPPTFEQNRLSGYSKDITKMWRCEACHANPNHLGITNATNACFVCHK